jgi:hypothetical protein
MGGSIDYLVGNMTYFLVPRLLAKERQAGRNNPLPMCSEWTREDVVVMGGLEPPTSAL